MSKLVANFALVIPVLALAALAITHNLLSPLPLVIAGQLAGLAVAIWARGLFAPGSFRVTAGPATESVLRRGPYRVVRHPMYAGTLLLVWSSILGHWSWFTAVVGVTVTLMAAWRIVVEERLLQERYPDYAQYARSTKRLIPFLV